jgi:SAM-dependent methyltransferase
MDTVIYRTFNRDLQKFTPSQLVHHFKHHGYREGRVHNLDSLLQRNIYLKYFDLEYYIKHNPDLIFNTKRDYVLDFLNNRLDDSRPLCERLTTFKTQKQALFADKLDPNYVPSFEAYKIGMNETESANEWGEDSELASLIHTSKSVLNIGAGYRLDKTRYFSLSHVINTEVFNYPTTDVVCDGDHLPFKDNSFDLVLSLAVLEHVKNPWTHAKEMLRVLKPGGILYADVPFLQPYHGYPHHYYNMTTAGVRNLFEKNIDVIQHRIEPWSKPIFSLTWFLNNYCAFLDRNTRQRFKKLTIEEILHNGNNTDLDYVKNMDKAKEEIIACGSTLIGRKKPQDESRSSHIDDTDNDGDDE